MNTVINKDLLTFNQRIELAGIETIRETGKPIELRYNGITIPRPPVHKIELICKKYFDLDI